MTPNGFFWVSSSPPVCLRKVTSFWVFFLKQCTPLNATQKQAAYYSNVRYFSDKKLPVSVGMKLIRACCQGHNALNCSVAFCVVWWCYGDRGPKHQDPSLKPVVPNLSLTMRHFRISSDEHVSLKVLQWLSRSTFSQIVHHE